LDPGLALSEFEDFCPVASQLAKKIASATASDVSVQAWQRTAQHVGKNAWRESVLRELLFRFVAYIGSSSGVEQTFSQCMAQFRHLRNFKTRGVQRVLVLAGTRGQPQEEDLALLSRARQIWAENFGAPRRRGQFHIFSGKSLRRKSKNKVCCRRRQPLAVEGHWLSPACRPRRKYQKTPGSEIASSRLWGAAQQKELERQKHLQKER